MMMMLNRSCGDRAVSDSADPALRAVSCLAAMFEDPASTFADVSLQTSDGQLLKAHRGVLATQSRFFKDLFSSSAEPIVPVEDVSFEALHCVVRFAYTMEVALPRPANAIEVLAAADFFELGPLRKHVEARLFSALTVDAATELLLPAHRAAEDRIVLRLLKFLAANATQALRSRTAVKYPVDLASAFVSHPLLAVPANCVEILLYCDRWAAARRNASQECAQLFECVSLDFFTARELRDHAETSAYLDQQVVAKAYRRLALTSHLR
ncbi:Ring canal kelch-like protein [Diplonema papillatum]|nr:Ring canal kelch-like protein [Diplonema papillatum]